MLFYRSALVSVVAAASVCFCSRPARAQSPLPNLFKCTWNQPWTEPYGSFVSIVKNCGGQQLNTLPIALDDFECEQNGTLRRVVWWGSIAPGDTPPPNFYIRIWTHSNNQCRPNVPLSAGQCVTPMVLADLAEDCEGRRVCVFSAALPTPVGIPAGHHWIQISEIDDSSPTPDAPDWKWSAHRPVRVCQAVQRSAAGVITQPLNDPCVAAPQVLHDDLAFAFRTASVIFRLRGPAPADLAARAYTVEIIDPMSNVRLGTETVMFKDDPQPFSLPHLFPMDLDGWIGTLKLVIRAPGALPIERMVTVPPNGADIDLGELPMTYGDTNGDGRLNFQDLTYLLANWRP
jgi:hypothetical protein